MTKRYKILNDLIVDCARIRELNHSSSEMYEFAGDLLSYIYEFHAEELNQGISVAEAHGGESSNDIKSEIPNTVRDVGATPTPGYL